VQKNTTTYFLDPIRNTWRLYYLHFNLFLKEGMSLYSTQDKISRINQYLHQTDTVLLQKIQSSEFWAALKTAMHYDQKCERLEKKWKALHPLMHLNTGDLLTLLQEEISPLRALFEKHIALLQNQNTLGGWQLTAVNDLLLSIQANDNKLQSLQRLIYKHLILRCQTHKALNAYRNVDDLLAYFAHEINLLNIPNIKLNSTLPHSATLNDDRRLIIYDVLKKHTSDINALLDSVIHPIPRRYTKALSTRKKVEQNTEKLDKFCKEIMTSTLFKKKHKNVIFRSPKKIAYSIDKIISYCIKKMTINNDYSVWVIKTLFLLLCSITLYGKIGAVLYPILKSFFPAYLALVDAVFFVGIGLAPLTFHLISIGSRCINSCYRWFTQKEQKNVIEALSDLKESNVFIATKISHPIIDIPHFDIHSLRERALFYNDKLQKSQKKISKLSIIKRLFLKNSDKKLLLQVTQKILFMKGEIHLHLNMLANNISKRIQIDIDVVEKNNTVLMPLISRYQLQAYHAFVVDFGNKRALNTFNNNTDIIKRWISTIDQLSQADPKSVRSLNTSWGGYSVPPNTLVKWDLLLEYTVLKPEKALSCVSLNQFIRCEKSLSQKELTQHVNQISSVDNGVTIMRTLQNFIFNTLNASNLMMAQFLSHDHKQLVNNWYTKNKTAIDNAQNAFIAIVNAYTNNEAVYSDMLAILDDKTIQHYYALLDAKSVYLYANNASLGYENIARKLFIHYQGETSRLYAMTPLVPHCEQQSLVISMAKKRLSWILSHLDDSDPFDNNDELLFHDPWLETQSDFNFTQIIIQSKQFNDFNCFDKMQRFLDICDEHLYLSEDLASLHKTKHYPPKPLLIRRADEKQLVSFSMEHQRQDKTVLRQNTGLRPLAALESQRMSLRG